VTIRGQPELTVGRNPPGRRSVDAGDAVTLKHVLEHGGEPGGQRHDNG
jgi:hypothetical protein